MENENKCSSNEHQKINEILICKEENHHEPLKFFCKTHNKLCCSSCIYKIDDKRKGQHKDCNVCNIEDIKEDKKNKLKENLNNLEKLSNTIDESIYKFKLFYEKINKNKEELKSNILKIFTKIRNILNEREDELLSELDKIFDKECFKENIIIKSEKLPNNIKKSIEKGKIIDKEWNNNNKLNVLIQECIDIENNVKDINIISEIIQKKNLKNNFNVTFLENNNDKILGEIKKFGKIIPCTKLEYIESNGNQYIDTGIIANCNYNYVIDFSLSNIIRNDTKLVGVDQRPIIFLGTLKSQFTIYGFFGEIFLPLDLNRHTCTIGKNIIFDNTTYFRGLSFNNSYSVCIFNAHTYNSNKYAYGTSMKLYHAKVILNETLIRDFIPVLNNDGIPCLLDTIEGKFYYNSGYGNFNYKEIK